MIVLKCIIFLIVYIIVNVACYNITERVTSSKWVDNMDFPEYVSIICYIIGVVNASISGVVAYTVIIKLLT